MINPIKGDLVVVRCLMFMVCLLLSSCTKHNTHRQQKSIEQVVDTMQDDYLDFIIQQEAMLIDIPIPLYDERILSSSFSPHKSDTLVFGYKSPLSLIQAIDFFAHQMERLGWKHLISFEGIETILQFKSPDRYCTVIIRSFESTHSSIFIYLKKASTNACPN